MGFLQRLLGRRDDDLPGPDATLGDLLDYLEARRHLVEIPLLARHRTCPACSSDYLRVGAWAKDGAAGWMVTCVNCGKVLERTVEIEVGE